MTHAAKVLIQKLYEAVDDFQCDQLIVLLFNCTTEIQASVPAGTHTHRCIETVRLEDSGK